MQVTKEGIERIKSANDLAAVVSERGVELQKKGRQLVGRCPFHEEKTASFNVSSSKGLFHCFGCGVSGDVIGFVTRHDKLSFSGALETLARRAGLDLPKLMEERPRGERRTPLAALTPPGRDERAAGSAAKVEEKAASGARNSNTAPPSATLSRVVEHYHRTLVERKDAQDYLRSRGLGDTELWRVFKLGYADGSLLKLAGKDARAELEALGVLSEEGRELMGGCLVFPIPDPATGTWTTLYGRGMKTARHCYLPGPLRGVWNYQAALLASEVVLTESVIDALSFHQVGVTSAVPLYGANGFTAEHLDVLVRNPSKRVVLCLDNDEAGKKAASALGERLVRAGLAVRLARLPDGVKDPNELLVSRNGDAVEALRAVLAEARQAATSTEARTPAAMTAAASSSAPSPERPRIEMEQSEEHFVARIGARRYEARSGGRATHDSLRLVLRVEGEGGRFLVDTLDLYAARSRREYANRAAARLGLAREAAGTIEEELLELIAPVEAYRRAGEENQEGAKRPELSAEEREEALLFLRRPDLLEAVSRDIEFLGTVGEETNARLLYLVASSRKLQDPLSAIVLSQSGAGKSGLTETIEKLCPPEDVVLLTRLTPQSLYYVAPGFLDRKLVIVEERYGSLEADYSIRVLQSRKKLIAAAPIKDPQTGNLRTKVFTVEARAAFVEATTASSVNHENATRCFELVMDESPEQTRRIHERQRLQRTEAGLRLRREADAVCRRHWNAQRLLEPLPVVIPFAERLSFPSSWMRTRRDHARFLNLIEVVAFLHQHQRERKEGAVVASERDYAVAYELAGSVLSETLTDLRKPLRELLCVVRDLALEKGEAVTRRELRERTHLPDTTLVRYLRELVDLEYLRELRGKGTGPLGYAPASAEAQAKSAEGLIAPDELRKLLEA